MKPDGVLLNEMDEAEVAPSEMFCKLGMLIVESRVPHNSAKGRTEGPHCPHSPGDGPRHQCKPRHDAQCKQAEAVQHQMYVLWKNHIPMCIEVLLYEDCQHGEQKAASVDVTMPSSSDNYILLEQWTVQIVPRRGTEGQVRPRELFQALKSYLHFSQLSAWLNLTQGKAPKNVGYRISPPGEFCISSFRETPQWHTFPMCTLSHNAAVKVTMGCLPRRHDNQLLHVPCHLPHAHEQTAAFGSFGGEPCAGATGGTNIGSASRNNLLPLAIRPPDGTWRDVPQFVSPQRPHARIIPPRHYQHQRQQQQQPQRKKMSPPLHRTNPQSLIGRQMPKHNNKKRLSIQEVTPTAIPNLPATSMQQSKPVRLKSDQPQPSSGEPRFQASGEFNPTTLEDLNAQKRKKYRLFESIDVSRTVSPEQVSLTEEKPNTFDIQKQSGAIPKKFTPQKSSTLPLEMHSAPDLDLFDSELGGIFGCGSTSSKSPKVLFTKKSPGQAYFHKDDGRWILNAAGTSCSDSADSDQSSPEIDKYLKNMKTRADPLSPEEIQNYLASLSIKHRKRQPSPLAKTPSPEFIDSNSPAVKDLTSILSSFGDEKDSSTKKQPLHLCDISTTAKTPEDDRPGDCDFDLSDASKKAFACDVVKVKSQNKEASLYSQDERNWVACKESVSHGSKPKEKCDQNASLISSRKDQEIAAYKNTVSTQLCKKQDSTGKQGVQGERQTESSDNKVLFSLGGDEQEEDGDSDVDGRTVEGVEDDLVITPRSGMNGASGDHKQHQYTNGVHLEEDPSSSHANSQVSPSMTNGHVPDCEITDDSIINSEYRVTQSRQSPMKRSVSDSESIKRSISEASGFAPMLPGINKASPLYKTLMMREMSNLNKKNDEIRLSSRPIPTPQERASFRKSLESSSHMIFHASTGLPLQSSPAPIKKRASDTFEYDQSLNNPRAIKNSLSCVNLDEQNKNDNEPEKDGRFYSTSAPASTNCLLGNFEESLLNGRIEPTGVVEGFTAEIGASGAFCPKHVTLPVTAFFFNLSDDNAPSPYLGHINLEKMGKRGYQIPKKGTVQVTLFNPNKTVVKMFVVVYDLTDMPANCQTFLRQRTLYMPVSANRNTKPEDIEQPVYLRYLIHLRFQSSKSGKVYLHTDMRMIFARDKFEYDSRVANYELRSFTDAPTNPKFSPKR